VRCRGLWLGSLALIGSACGCGNGQYPVAGVVLLDGAPLDGAIVILQPEGGGQPALATTGADGKFKVSTAAGLGAIPGEYRFSVSKVTNRKGERPPPWVGRVGKPPTSEERAAWERKLAEERKQEREWVPKPYDALPTTPLRFTVPLKEELVVELSSTSPANTSSAKK
jgi:hypothetical protein